MMERPRFPTIDGLIREGRSWRGDRKAQAWMLIRHDVLLVPLDESTTSLPQVKAQKRKQSVVEGHRGTHVSDGDLDVVNERFHGRIACWFLARRRCPPLLLLGLDDSLAGDSATFVRIDFIRRSLSLRQYRGFKTLCERDEKLRSAADVQVL